jgi:hypothetical protein
MGFCRTNLFKRLESSGFSFLQSIDRHILRNQIYLYAIENGLRLAVGVLDAGLLDLERVDEDAEGLEGDRKTCWTAWSKPSPKKTPAQRHGRAKAVYEQYATEYKRASSGYGPACSRPSWPKTWRKTPRPASSCSAAKALGPRQRPQAAGAAQAGHADPWQRQGADLHPVRRHGALPCA